ncbi:hypothetical protein HDV00_011278 [Rhizophlyctis rosea]|nr:hypothetical protein HDV00_011278 [Rhizophlyctis rosea]
MIHLDDEMYDEEQDKHVAPQSWNLCDDLGQIEYIFSDKTGTLTCNMMDFRKCSINGVLYGKGVETDAERGRKKRDGGDGVAEEKKEMDEEEGGGAGKEGEAERAEREMRGILGELFDTRYISKSKLPFVDPLLAIHLKENAHQAMRIREFFTLLAVCHTVLVESDAATPNDLIYKAQSPDEAALVSAARDVGFAFLRRRENKVTVDVCGSERTYEILNVLEFNSDRKRMSVVMRRPEGEVVILCKGADSVIIERLKDRPEGGHHHSHHHHHHHHHHSVIRDTMTHLESFANEGLRTLCLAYRVIPEDEYARWAETYTAAQQVLVDREKAVDEAAEGIERELVLMGATAIEDKLQEGVPECVDMLGKAGIKVWVLTGDKMETAINIGFACNLLKRDQTIIVIRSTNVEETERQLMESLERFWDGRGKVRSEGGGEGGGGGKRGGHALVIDGESLKFGLEGRCKGLLLELGCRCQAVVCCRVSPLQKAKVVELVRKGLGAMCLAIGDGANDVSMIQEADVGIGISGKEGLQAVMASDYAIAQFRFLSRLLLVHGRWAFTSVTVTEFTYSMFFNTIFTILPTMFVGMLDQDVNDRLSMSVPQLYRKGIRQTLFTLERFWLYNGVGIFQSLICYYFAKWAFQDSVLTRAGYTSGISELGTIIAFGAVFVVNIFTSLNTYAWTWLIQFALGATLVVWTVYAVAYAGGVENPTYGQSVVLYKGFMFYATVAISVLLSLLPRIAGKAWQQMVWPNDTDIVQEVQKEMGRGVEVDLEEIRGEKHHGATFSGDSLGFGGHGSVADFGHHGSLGRLSEMGESHRGSGVTHTTGSVESMDRYTKRGSARDALERVKVEEGQEVPGGGLKRNFSDGVLDRTRVDEILEEGMRSGSMKRSASDHRISGVGGHKKEGSARSGVGGEPSGAAVGTSNATVGLSATAVRLDTPVLQTPPSPVMTTRTNISDGFGSQVERPRAQRPRLTVDAAGAREAARGYSGPSSSEEESEGSHSMRRRSSILNATKGTLTRMGKATGSLVKRLRMPSHHLRKHTRGGSLVYMANGQEMNNTGFAFAHDEGMREVITPSRCNLPEAPSYLDVPMSNVNTPNASPQRVTQQTMQPPTLTPVAASPDVTSPVMVAGSPGKTGSGIRGSGSKGSGLRWGVTSGEDGPDLEGGAVELEVVGGDEEEEEEGSAGGSRV